MLLVVAASLITLIDASLKRFADRPAYCCLGKVLTFQDLDQASGRLAAWLSAQGLSEDARVAVMMPNILQNPIAITAILRSGFVVVNINPLYTPRELAHQLNDAGPEVILMLENFGHVLQQAIEAYGLPDLKMVVMTEIGDSLGLKGRLINGLVRYVKRMVPAWRLPSGLKLLRWRSLMATAATPPTRPDRAANDLAFLQYTGGTTGVAKGAMLTHGNILANIEQCASWLEPEKIEAELATEKAAAKAADKGAETTTLTMVCALPLYHIFSLTACMMLGLKSGFCNLLIPNPRDLKATIKTLRQQPVHLFPGVNTLFNALLNHPDIGTVDFSALRVTVGGGMAVTASVAERWKASTGCPMLEGYGLSETSPVVAATPRSLTNFTASVGLAMPGTELLLLNEQGEPAAEGETGEIAVRGPQVTQGYWRHPEETKAAFTSEGFFKTGDLGRIDEKGYLHILDSKKDMILVSGFNVYPSEVEQVVCALPGVSEAAAIGIPDPDAGEAVKLFVVKRDPMLTEDMVRRHCISQLTNYKRPRVIEFRPDLPKTNVGKVLRRALR
jgi:long-chain acyl-CoA synthetase